MNMKASKVTVAAQNLASLVIVYFFIQFSQLEAPTQGRTFNIVLILQKTKFWKHLEFITLFSELQQTPNFFL